jgi:hypothetical protein
MTRHLFGRSRTLGGSAAVARLTTLTDHWERRAARDSPAFAVPAEFSPRDYVIFLLQIAAEIEHALMVQYLYSAYSLGGSGVPERHRARVQTWREVILGIAKEEMGHLISVQNVLRLLGGPVHLDREDYPWGIEFYPFPFKLERFTAESLARYIYAESPDARDWGADELPLRDEIIRLATAGDGETELHRVGELFDLLIGRVQDPGFLADHEFDAATFSYQASWAEWGRGYRAGERGNARRGGPPETPDVIVVPLASRDQAVAALQAIASQGEAPRMDDSGARSHFRRFFDIFKQLRAIQREEPEFAASRPVPDNPRTPRDLNPEVADAVPNEWVEDGARGAIITDPRAQDFAHLFNLRYRMLLAYLAHAYSLSGALVRAGQLTMRGTIVNFTFGEMYNLRAVAEILVELPLGDAVHRAAPPFEMPYSLVLPARERDCYRLHRDLLLASHVIEDRLRRHGAGDADYLAALHEADARTLAIVDRCIREPQAREEAP